ncbi:MAG: magnesium chelatase domain-containing protein [Phycisphaerales bacterium]
MLARVQSYLLQGIDALACEVEVDSDIADENKPAIVVGLPDTAVKESTERVRAALANSGYLAPRGRTVINLAPADIRKEGPLYDLPIAIGLLIVQGVVASTQLHRQRRRPVSVTTPLERGPVPAELEEHQYEPIDPRQFLFAGELALDGRVRPIKGAIAMAALAQSRGARGVVVPAENAAEAAMVPGIEVLGVRTIAEVVGLLNGEVEARPEPAPDIDGMLRSASAPIDFSEVRGQESVKRAIIIAAAGQHNLIQLWAGASDGQGSRRPAVGHNVTQLWAGASHGRGVRGRSVRDGRGCRIRLAA